MATEQLLGTFMTVGEWIPWTVLPRKGKMLNGEKEPWEPDTAEKQLAMIQEALSVPQRFWITLFGRGGRLGFLQIVFPHAAVTDGIFIF